MKHWANGTFTGYASVFFMRDDHNDIIDKGAFSFSVRHRPVVLLWQHQHTLPVGKILLLQEDSFGLFIIAQLHLQLALARDILSLMQARIVDSLSIGYKVLCAGYDEASRARVIKRIDLWEVSIVTFPANKRAKILEVYSSHT